MVAIAALPGPNLKHLLRRRNPLPTTDIPPTEFAERTKKVRNAMTKGSLDAMIVATPASVRYLSNYDVLVGRAMVLLPASGEPTLFIDQAWDLARAKDVSSIPDTRALTDFGRELSSGMGGSAPKKVGIVGWEGFPAPIHITLTKQLPGTSFVDSTEALEDIRMVKSDFEVGLLKEVAKMTDAGAEAAVRAIREGKTELEVAVAAESEIRMLGAEGPSFPTIVGSGERTELIVPLPTKRKPAKGELVLLDFGAKYNGYRGDISRTKQFGQLGKEQSDLFEVVTQMHAAGVKAVKPGVGAAELHRVTSKVAEEAGLGQYVMHMTGHGLGLDEHEKPILETEQTKVYPKMIITIEPGLYVPKVGGVRIEDTVLVTETGGELMNFVDRRP